MICSLLLRLLLQETKQKPSKSPSLLLLFFSSPTHRQQWNNHSRSLERKPASLSIWCHAALRLSKSMTNYQPTNLPIIRTWNSNAFLLQCLLPVCLPSLPPSLPPSLKKIYYLWKEKKRKNWRHNSSLLFLVSNYISMRNSNTNRIFPQKSNQTNKQTTTRKQNERRRAHRSNTKTKQEIPPSPRTRLFFRWPWYIGKNDKFQIKSVKKLSAFWDFQ